MNQKTLPNDYVNSMVLNDATNEYYGGLTKREYFAAMTMQGIVSNSKNHLITFDDITGQSVKLADLLIKELNK